jgi:hypothetical protein
MRACPNLSPNRKHKHSGTGVQEKLNLLKACPNQKLTARTLHTWELVVKTYTPELVHANQVEMNRTTDTNDKN